LRGVTIASAVKCNALWRTRAGPNLCPIYSPNSRLIAESTAIKHEGMEESTATDNYPHDLAAK
jgi:hypothetical protein